MKFLRLLLFLAMAGVVVAQQKPPVNEAEERDLSGALAEAGNSPVDFMRALENHLAKYPNSAHKSEIERALVKSAIEAKDDRRLILYGERVLAGDFSDLQVLDRVARALVSSDDKANAEKALKYSKRYDQLVSEMRMKPAPGSVGEAQWREDLDRGSARALVLEARATGNLGNIAEAVALAKRSYDTYPSAEAARETGRWLMKSGKNIEAVERYADAFTLEDPKSTEVDRAADRMRMGELYQKANGTEKGLGDLILQAYDRTRGLISDRLARLKAADPNSQASKVLDFTLPGLNGEKLPLAALKGKTIVFDFWATWCGPCRAQHPLYRQVEELFRDQPGVVFLSVNTDEDHELVAPFLKAQHWENKVYFESGLSRSLQISSIPTTIIVDRNGQIASRMNGFAPERFVDLLTARIRDTLKN